MDIAIGGIRGGSGKTLVTVGLIKALSNRGVTVAPFKKGPDYIDTAWLTRASGTHTFNLDTFLMSRTRVRDIYTLRNSDKDIAVMEGNRGIYDGFDLSGTHSFAEMVKLLRIPLVLVVDCSKSSRTVAALVKGCRNFDRSVPLSGVILNQVAGNRHREMLTGSIEHYTSIPVIGAVPRIAGISMRERHLGLVPVHENGNTEEIIEMLGTVIEDNVDIDRLLRIAGKRKRRICNPSKWVIPFKDAEVKRTKLQESQNLYESSQESEHISASVHAPVIGVFMDPAFNFYYRENIEAMVSYGAVIREINAMEEISFPDVHALYIGGGFPETHAPLLSRNTLFIDELRKRIENGMPVYAECGGLVYLSESITCMGEKFPLAGIFPFNFELSNKPQGHGYTLFTIDKGNPFYDTGIEVHGHEFRYSRVTNPEVFRDVTTIFTMGRGTGIAEKRDGLVYKNVLATFSHTHAESENVQWIKNLVGLAEKVRLKNG